MSIAAFLCRVREVACERSLKDFLKECFTYATHLITYHIMYMNTNSVELINYSSITLLPITVDDIETLSSSSFGNHDFLKPILVRNDPLYKCYIAQNNHNEYVGFCIFMMKGAPYNTFDICHTDAYLSEFYISREFQNQGLGSKVLSNACRLLQDEGISEIKLAVRNYNQPAIHCYKNVGFTLYNKFSVFIFHHRRAFPHYKI